jgi:hypothetical protein
MEKNQIQFLVMKKESCYLMIILNIQKLIICIYVTQKIMSFKNKFIIGFYARDAILPYNFPRA